MHSKKTTANSSGIELRSQSGLTLAFVNAISPNKYASSTNTRGLCSEPPFPGGSELCADDLPWRPGARDGRSRSVRAPAQRPPAGDSGNRALGGDITGINTTAGDRQPSRSATEADSRHWVTGRGTGEDRGNEANAPQQDKCRAVSSKLSRETACEPDQDHA